MSTYLLEDLYSRDFWLAPEALNPKEVLDTQLIDLGKPAAESLAYWYVIHVPDCRHAQQIQHSQECHEYPCGGDCRLPLVTHCHPDCKRVYGAIHPNEPDCDDGPQHEWSREERFSFGKYATVCETCGLVRIMETRNLERNFGGNVERMYVDTLQYVTSPDSPYTIA